jgi:hypothetical protein
MWGLAIPVRASRAQQFELRPVLQPAGRHGWQRRLRIVPLEAFSFQGSSRREPGHRHPA